MASAELGLFVVADGLSVKEGGARAAAIVIERMEMWAKRERPLLESVRLADDRSIRSQVKNSLDHAVQEASRAIFQEASANSAQHGMCTTLDILVRLGNYCLVAHVGCGRAYLVRQGDSHLLTEDHTQLAYLRRTGKAAALSASEQASAAKRLTRAVGFREETKVDFLEVETEAGDRFFLLSDGAWQALPEEQLLTQLASGEPLAKLLPALHGQFGVPRDNFTTVALQPDVVSMSSAAAGAEQKLQMLGKVPAFEFLSYQELLKVLATGDLVKFGEGHTLCREGAAGGEMMLLLTGTADVTKSGQRIRKLGRGDVVGEMSMIDNEPRSASVIASAPTNVIAFRREALFDLFREDSSLAVKFLWGVARQMNFRLRSASNQLVGKPVGDPNPPLDRGPWPFTRGL